MENSLAPFIPPQISDLGIVSKSMVFIASKKETKKKKKKTKKSKKKKKEKKT